MDSFNQALVADASHISHHSQWHCWGHFKLFALVTQCQGSARTVMKYGSGIPRSLERRADASVTSVTMGILPLGAEELLALMGFSQFGNWEVTIPEVSAFWPLWGQGMPRQSWKNPVMRR